jgi:hypothetical protein
MTPDRMPITEAAQRMGVTPQLLRLSLRRGLLPFGYALLVNKRWAYVIIRARFEAYMQGRDMAAGEVN